MPQRILLLWLWSSLALADSGSGGALPGARVGSGVGPEALPRTRAHSPSRAASASGPAPRCLEDAALAQAAAELLLTGGPPAPDAMVQAVRDAGSDAVGVRALYLPAPDRSRRARWLARLGADDAGEWRCGDAFGSDGVLSLAAPLAGGLYRVEPGEQRLRGWLAEGFTRPELVVADAEGRMQRLTLEPSQLREGVPIGDDLSRPARVQLLARGPSGPRPIAERVLVADDGDDAPALAVVDEGLPPGARLRELRRLSGVPDLRDNRLLSKLAQAHAARVCQEGRVAHVLDDGLDPKARLEKAGLRARRVGEAVARADHVAGAFTAMGQSPSHRMTLLGRGFTDVGIGAGEDARHRACLVVLLAEWPRFVGR